MIIKIFSYSNILRTLNKIYKNSIYELKYINDFNKKTKEFKKSLDLIKGIIYREVNKHI